MYTIEAFNLSEKKIKGKEPVIHPTAIIRECRFGEYTEVMAFTQMEETTLDDYSYLCPNIQVIYTDIGKFSNIASNCRINPGFHPMERPTLHHFTYRSEEYGFDSKDDEKFFHWRRIQKVIIGHDTWIGHGVVIMPGVKIGHGAVIGSNSVVTKDIPTYAIAVGSPAKVVRRRFSKDISDALDKTEWWNWDHSTIKERFEDFKDIRAFIWKYGK